jgi:hypothetical protein
MQRSAGEFESPACGDGSDRSTHLPHPERNEFDVKIEQHSAPGSESATPIDGP